MPAFLAHCEHGSQLPIRNRPYSESRCVVVVSINLRRAKELEVTNDGERDSVKSGIDDAAKVASARRRCYRSPA